MEFENRFNALPLMSKTIRLFKNVKSPSTTSISLTSKYNRLKLTIFSIQGLNSFMQFRDNLKLISLVKWPIELGISWIWLFYKSISVRLPKFPICYGITNKFWLQISKDFSCENIINMFMSISFRGLKMKLSYVIYFNFPNSVGMDVILFLANISLFNPFKF